MGRIGITAAGARRRGRAVGEVIVRLQFSFRAPFRYIYPRMRAVCVALGLSLGLSACAANKEADWLADVPRPELDAAVQYMLSQRVDFENPDIVTLIDYSKHSSQKRMYVVNLTAQTVNAYRVSHGQGSDRDHDGWLDAFGNQEGSHMSPYGFFKVAEPYEGQHGAALRLDGLDAVNQNARDRAIVIHGASYMTDVWEKPGRSWGCPAVQYSDMKVLYTELPGSLLYIIDRVPTPETRAVFHEEREKTDKKQRKMAALSANDS